MYNIRSWYVNHPHRRLTFIVIYINISTRITRIRVCVCGSDSYFNIKTDGPAAAAAGCILLRGPKGQDKGGGCARSKCGSAVVGGRRQSRCACSLGVAGGVSPRRRRRPTTTAAVPSRVLILRSSASAHVSYPTSLTHPPAHDCIFTHRAVVVSVEIIRPFRLPNTATAINARNVYTRARQRPWWWSSQWRRCRSPVAVTFACTNFVKSPAGLWLEPVSIINLYAHSTLLSTNVSRPHTRWPFNQSFWW